MTVNLTQGLPLQETDLNTYFYTYNKPYSPVFIRYELGYEDPVLGYTKIGPTNRMPIEAATGRFRPNFILDERAQVGSYKITWRYKVTETAPIKERVYYFYTITEGIYKNRKVVSTYDKLRVLFYTITPNDISNRYSILPVYPHSASVNIVAGTSVQPGVDYVISGQQMSWEGLGLDGLLVAGDILRIIYVEEDIYKSFTPYETLSTVFHDITSLDLSNKYLTIEDTMAKAAVNVVFGTAAQLGVDYSFFGNKVTWGGMGLDGDLRVGDTLRIIYVKETCPEIL